MKTSPTPQPTHLSPTPTPRLLPSPFRLRPLDRALLAFICFLLPFCGCVSSGVRIVNPDQYAFDNNPVLTFTFSTWIDRNLDDHISFDELLDYNKQIFHDGETVCFGISIQGKPIGTTFHFCLFAPGASQPTEKVDCKTAYSENITHQDYAVGPDLLAKYGPGEYRMEWYVHDNFVGSSTIAVIGPAPTSQPAAAQPAN